MDGLLAHMGGIDEIAMFLVPAAVVIFLMRRAERRAQERVADQADEGETVGDQGEVPQ